MGPSKDPGRLSLVSGMAEGVGFEPTEGTSPSTAFKAAAFVHSATPPIADSPEYHILCEVDSTGVSGCKWVPAEKQISWRRVLAIKSGMPVLFWDSLQTPQVRSKDLRNHH